MTDYDPDVDLEGLVSDDIVPVAPAGTPPGFNLMQLLSESMRSREPWRELARVTSRVLYDYVEKYRIALGLARSPENLDRSLKVLTLRMLGIDWKSDNLTDEDYDRMINAVSLYQENHGPVDFVRFIGYGLGVPLELMPLWSKDYVHFDPASFHRRALFDTPPGEYYPTTHVGILYEEFAANVDKIDEAELKRIFYKMAPINLVLDWIASQITMRIELIMCATAFERGEDTAVCVDPAILLRLSLQAYERGEDTVLLDPDHPARELAIYVGAGCTEESVEFSSTLRLGVDFDYSDAAFSGVLRFSEVDLIPSRDNAGEVVFVEDSTSDWRSPDLSRRGYLVQPARYSIIRNSRSLFESSYVKSSGVTIGTDTWEGLTVQRVTIANQASISAIAENGTHVVSWLVARVSGARYAKIVRGTNYLIYDYQTKTIVQTSVGLVSGVINEGSDVVTIWARMTGSDIVVYPCWGNILAGDSNAAGVIDWGNLQAEPNANYPRAMISTNNTVPFLERDSRFDPNVFQEYLFAHGIVAVHAAPTFAEWTSEELVLLDFRDGLGHGIKLTVQTNGALRFRVTSLDGVQEELSTATAVAGQTLKFGFTWNRETASVRLWANGWFEDVAVVFPSNLSSTTLFREFNSNVKSTWVVERAIVTGYDSLAEMPSAPTQSWLFT